MTVTSLPLPSGARSHMVDLGGPVHYVDLGGPPQAPLLVLVHGLGGSHLDWMAIASELSGHVRMLAIDLIGHGLTPCGDRVADVESHRRLVGAFLHDVAGGPAILVGHSMGGFVAALQAAKDPATVSGLVLIDPALPTVSGARVNPTVLLSFVLCAIPGLGEWYLPWRWRHSTPEREVHRALASMCFDPSRVQAELVDARVELSRRVGRKDVDTAYLQSTRSLCALLLHPRTSEPTLTTIDQPVLLLHGDEDTLIHPNTARRMSSAHPQWHFVVAQGVGHAPMLEVPGWTAHQITNWMSLQNAGVAVAARRGSVGPPYRSV